MNRTILFNTDAVEIIEQYMQDNTVTFNRAVNTIIKEYKELKEKQITKQKQNKSTMQSILTNTETIINLLNK